MTLTPEEQRRRLQAVLKAKKEEQQKTSEGDGHGQRKTNRKSPFKAYAERQKESLNLWRLERGFATLPTESDHPQWKNRAHWEDTPGRQGEIVKGAKHHAHSPYVFVPLNTVICPPENVWGVHLGPGRTTSRIYPLRTGLSAEIDVEWIVETPLLAGEQKKENNQTVIAPVTLGNGNQWVIPGATLRGHIRSILQIIAFGRLWPFNNEERYGLRDFLHPFYGGEEAAVSKAQEVHAGWLERTKDGEWRITPCKWGYVKIDSNSMRFADWPEWLTKRRPEKYAETGAFVNGEYDFSEATQRNFQRVDERNGIPVYEEVTGGSLSGHYVFSGAFPVKRDRRTREIITNERTKRYEYVFTDKPGAQPVTIQPDALRRFEMANGKQVGNSIRKEGGWADFADAIDHGVRVPVFHVGDLERQDEKFAFGFTRMFKIAHRFSVGDMACNTNPHHLPRRDASAGDGAKDEFYRPDFVENLFGYVHEPEHLGLEAAWQRKGRVSFGFAVPGDASAFELTEIVETIMGAPQASFAPFYLRGRVKDWSWADSELAGRKRYVPRYPENAGNSWLDIRQRLENQIARARQAAREPSADARTRLRFLKPVNGRKAVFRSRIRLFNVTRAELGAVLWALTFGGETEKYRHMIGHARPFGAGQVKIGRVRLTARPNDPRNDVWRGMDVKEDVIEDCPHEPFMKAFEAHMGNLLQNWRETKVMTCYLASCDPRLWSGEWPQYPDFPKGFTALRKATQLLKGEQDALPDAPAGAFLSSCAPPEGET